MGPAALPPAPELHPGIMGGMQGWGPHQELPAEMWSRDASWTRWGTPAGLSGGGTRTQARSVWGAASLPTQSFPSMDSWSLQAFGQLPGAQAAMPPEGSPAVGQAVGLRLGQDVGSWPQDPRQGGGTPGPGGEVRWTLTPQPPHRLNRLGFGLSPAIRVRVQGRDAHMRAPPTSTGTVTAHSPTRVPAQAQGGESMQQTGGGPGHSRGVRPQSAALLPPPQGDRGA